MNSMLNLFNEKAIIIVPTYNRKNFFPSLIYQFKYQDYPKELLEMIILDDSNESNIDYIDTLDEETKKRINYIYLSEKKNIGEKRNILNELAINANADYIICFDDDDYYPPHRVSYAVKEMKETGYLICGSSALLIYYPIIDKIYFNKSRVNKIFYGHAYNGTLAYNKKYALHNKYDNSKTMGEEQSFLKNFRVGLLQLEYDKLMLCIAHNSNTVDKHNNINNFEQTNYKLDDFIKDKFLLNFYKNIKN
jgi:hypothetical protein